MKMSRPDDDYKKNQQISDLDIHKDYKPRLIMTIDTECSAGGWPQKKHAKPLGYDSSILCQIGNKEYGIRYIMDVMESYSLTADFFVEPFCSYKLGISPLRDICQEIIGRGHGISLHLHPRWKLALNPDLHQLSDSMYDYAVDEQELLIREGVGILSECGVHKINAFRAGNLHGNSTTYEAMLRAGIPISSNYCSSWKTEATRYGLQGEVNDATLVDGIIEVPVTSFSDFPWLRPSHQRHLQIAAASKTEFRNVIAAAIEEQYLFIVILFHSFEWVHLEPNGFHKVDRIVVKRFHDLCELLYDYRDKIDVCKFIDIDTLQLSSDLKTFTSLERKPLISSDLAGSCRWIQHAVKKVFSI